MFLVFGNICATHLENDKHVFVHLLSTQINFDIGVYFCVKPTKNRPCFATGAEKDESASEGIDGLTANQRNQSGHWLVPLYVVTRGLMLV